MKRQPKGYYVRQNTEYTVHRSRVISNMRRDGYTLQQIANYFGLSRQRIHQILNGK